MHIPSAFSDSSLVRIPPTPSHNASPILSVPSSYHKTGIRRPHNGKTHNPHRVYTLPPSSASPPRCLLSARSSRRRFSRSPDRSQSLVRYPQTHALAVQTAPQNSPHYLSFLVRTLLATSHQSVSTQSIPSSPSSASLQIASPPRSTTHAHKTD